MFFPKEYAALLSVCDQEQFRLIISSEEEKKICSDGYSAFEAALFSALRICDDHADTWLPLRGFTSKFCQTA